MLFKNQVSLRGICLILLSLSAILIPDVSIEGFLNWLAIIFILFGLLNAISAARNIKISDTKWHFQLPWAVFDFALGISILVYLDNVSTWLIYGVGSLAIFLGLALFFVAKASDSFKPIIVANGIVSLVFAALIFFHEKVNISNVNLLIYFYIIIFGFLLTWYGQKIDITKKKVINSEGISNKGDNTDSAD